MSERYSKPYSKWRIESNSIGEQAKGARSEGCLRKKYGIHEKPSWA